MVPMESWVSPPSLFLSFFNSKKTVSTDSISGREEREGKMSRRWAEQYTDHGFYGSISPRICQNPHCGNPNIKSIHLLRHRISGEVIEIGTHCYERWRIALGLRPIDTDLWRKYIKGLCATGNKQRGQRITPSEMRKLEEATILELVNDGKLTPNSIPPNTDPEVRRRAEKNWILKHCKKNHITLRNIHQPLGNFPTIEDVHAWARERGGYCTDTRIMRGKKTWFVFVNPEYKKGEY